MNVKQFEEYYEKIRANCAKIIIGKDECIRNIVIVYLAGGHLSESSLRRILCLPT